MKSFHESVVRNRKDYLSSELEAAKLRIELRDGKKAQFDQRRGEVLGILKSHGALEQFLKLQGELGRLESEVESLRQRFEAAEQLEGTKNELEIERNRLTIRLRRDFAEQKDRLAEAIVAFEETSQRLYESAGSMTISASAHNADDIPNAPRPNGRGLWAYAPACCRRLHESVPSSTLAVRHLYVTKDGSPTRHPALQWSFHATPQARGRLLRQGRFHLVAGRCPCPCQGASR